MSKPGMISFRHVVGKFLPTISRFSTATATEATSTLNESSPLEYAFNYVERKKGLLKPVHTVEEQIAYMNSRVFMDTYKGLPIHKWYRRNMKVQPAFAPPPRLMCLNREGRFRFNHACPVCRDEYLFFDYRVWHKDFNVQIQNPALIKQFLMPGTDQPMQINQSGLCRDQYVLLKAQLLKAREHGTVEFCVEFRHFDYSQWYPSWVKNELDEEDTPIARRSAKLEDVFEHSPIRFPDHVPDLMNGLDQWWIRHDKFAKKAK